MQVLFLIYVVGYTDFSKPQRGRYLVSLGTPIDFERENTHAASSKFLFYPTLCLWFPNTFFAKPELF